MQRNNENLSEKLAAYGQSDFYPLHMPGHKRNPALSLFSFADTDITEIEGFDNLHAPEGIILSAEKKAAQIFGAKECFYLINGSTCGVLAALCATKKEGKKILMVRGSHKSAYHGIYLSGQDIAYIPTKLHPKFGCEMPPEAQDVREALQDGEFSAVFLVSPTYEGLCADIGAIAEAVHEKRIPLIVDAAHGAHLGFHEKWQENACRQGADLVIMSLHKTLPAPTQTALLAVGDGFTDTEKLRRFLRIYQSSSPSYPLMAAMEAAIEDTNAHKKERFTQFFKAWEEMMHCLSGCVHLRFLCEENSDIGKLVIRDASGTFSGKALYDRLLNRYHLQPEMATGEYVLAMFTVGDTKEGFTRTTEALLEIDRECGGISDVCGGTEKADAVCDSADKDTADANDDGTMDEKLPEAVLPLHRAWDAPREWVCVKEAKGRISGEFIGIYPPGRPYLIPGERIEETVIEKIRSDVQRKLHVEGIETKEDAIKICVIKNFE